MKKLASSARPLGAWLLIGALWLAAGPRLTSHTPQDGPAVAELPADIARLHATTMAQLSAPARSWITDQGRRAATGFTDGASFETATLAAIRSRFGIAQSTDAIGLAQLVLAEAYRISGDDLRVALTKLELSSQVRVQIREFSERLRAEIAATAGRPASDPCAADACAKLAKGLGVLMLSMRRADIPTITMSASLATIGDLRLIADQLDASAKRLESQSRDAESATAASRTHRERMREAINDFLAKVGAIKGSY